jgi:4-amino-4-deoxy-L-arabinose transferase-like glycosyltransferase
VNDRSEPRTGRGWRDVLLRNHRFVLTVFFALWFGFALLGAARAFSLEWDEGVFLQISLQHSRGQALYTDLFLTQPPLMVEMLSLVIRVFGNSVFACRFVMILFGLAANLITYLIARDLFGRPSSHASSPASISTSSSSPRWCRRTCPPSPWPFSPCGPP